ncbi:MAG: hypothetical protein HDS64_01085 [Bacteroidales bacterium]|nr:hypothetical protein [Bacteroidales bacterium]
MKWIKDPDSYNREMLALTPEAAKTIANLLKKARRDAQKKYDYYKDLHEAGEATERQQTLMVQYESLFAMLHNFISMTE